MENFTASLNYINTFNNVSLMIGNSLMLENDIELYGLFGGLSKGPFTFMFELDKANNLLQGYEKVIGDLTNKLRQKDS